MKGKARGLVLLAASAPLVLGAPGALRGQNTNGLPPAGGDTVLKSPSRHFLVEAPDGFTRQVLMRWAEQTAGRIEQVTGLSLPFENRIVRIVVRQGGSAGSNEVSITQARSIGTLVQSLLLPGSEAGILSDAREPLCRLLLAGFLPGRAGKGQPSASGAPSSVPCWLSMGIAGNLHPTVKARNSAKVLRRWSAGQLTPIAELLKAQTEAGEDPDKAVCGAFMTWVLSQPEKGECLRRVFERVAAGDPLSAQWFVPFVPGCATVADLDEQWDRWILQQKRVVYDPGLVMSDVIRQIEAQLTLYPGDSGIPLSTNLNERIEIRDLVARRKETWIAGVAQDRAMRLRVLSAGRGQELRDVVEAYCEFFEALGKNRTRVKTLEDLLAKAQSDLDLLRHASEQVEREQEP